VTPIRHLSELPETIRTTCRVTAQAKNDRCGVHLLANLPNRAIALSVDHIGWDKMSKMLFRIMREELRPTDNLFDYRDVLLAECARVSAQLPARSCEVLRQSFATVGL
jgi:Zn-dependent metalloprotease